jgi:hypothetical protein
VVVAVRARWELYKLSAQSSSSLYGASQIVDSSARAFLITQDGEAAQKDLAELLTIWEAPYSEDDD